jgi:hypothetical protein
MSQGKRMKLCSSCDGFVDMDVVVCPYCGSDLLKIVNPKGDDQSAGAQYKKKMSPEETLSSLYPPPYKPKNIPTSEPDKMLDKAQPASLKINLLEEEQKAGEEKAKEGSTTTTRALPILLFSLGVNILLIALYLLIFSTNGEIFIRWNASLWYVYFIVGVPLTFVGYKMISKYS